MTGNAARLGSSKWLHEQAMLAGDAARVVLDDPELAADLFDLGGKFENLALALIPDSRPRTRAILTKSRDWFSRKANRVRAGLPPDEHE